MKDVLFQILSILLLVGGYLFGNNFIFGCGIIMIVLAVVFWFRGSIIFPIKKLKNEIKNLRKDLNTRKEIENIKLKLSKLENDKKK